MKIIKLDKRFSHHKEGYTHALRFECYDTQAIKANDYFCRAVPTYKWKAYFGKKQKWNSRKPYYIVVRSEELLTFAVLSMQ